MDEWSLAGENFALILLAVIALFYYDAKPVRTFRFRHLVYGVSVGLCLVSVLLNISCVHIIENIHAHTIVFAMVLNSLYFFVVWLMTITLGFYLLLRMLEFVYDGHCMRRVRILEVAVFVVFTVLIIINIPSGIIFYFNEAGEYCRGPLNAVGYLVPATQIAMLALCYVRNHKSVSKVTKKVVFVSAPVAILLLALQFAYPHHQLNGMICAIVNLVVYISYGGGRTDVDSITGMENRRYFVTELIHRTRSKEHYQIILVKLQNMAAINRTYGSKGANVLLFQVGEDLQKAFDDCEVFRYDEEEFALLFADTNQVKRVIRMRQIKDIMHHRRKLGEYSATMKFSIMELCYSGETWTVDDINGYLSDAIYMCTTEELEILPFDEKLIYKRQRRKVLLEAMHHAWEEKLFQVWYQPVYYHDSGKFESAEALIRMYDKEGQMVSPGEFIPIAEETGQVYDLTKFVLEESCKLLSSKKIPDLKMISVNLPIRQVEEEDFRTSLQSILKKYNIAPERIRLEITERDIEKDGDIATDAICTLTEMGHHFVLDDFGVGYSNFARVMTMPLSCIKLDRSLVLLLQEDEKHRSIIKNTIVPLFKMLGQDVIAEGIETAEMAKFVLSCGVNCIQGYYYARPMPKNKLIEWYESEERIAN